MEEKDNAFEWRQFIRLGDMMGDGLHHEPGNEWIAKEYKRLSRFLIPGIREKERERKKRINKMEDERIKKRIKEKGWKCTCGGALLQTRSGSKTLKCSECKNKFSIISKKQ